LANVRKQQRAGAYRWPPRPTFAFYNVRGEALFSETDPSLDLADTLMLHWPRRSRKVILGITSGGTSWPTWTEGRLQHVEKLIKYDLNFDFYSVSIHRVTLRRWQPCTREFRWELQIRTK